LTVNATYPANVHADVLANTLHLDMASQFDEQLPAFLGRVSKPQILAAVREGVSPQAAERIADLKKDAMAQRAGEMLQGTGWLPEPLRAAPEGVVSEVYSEAA
jgi:ParB family chromosome partitioning protein